MSGPIQPVLPSVGNIGGGSLFVYWLLSALGDTRFNRPTNARSLVVSERAQREQLDTKEGWWTGRVEHFRVGKQSASSDSVV